MAQALQAGEGAEVWQGPGLQAQRSELPQLWDGLQAAVRQGQLSFQRQALQSRQAQQQRGCARWQACFALLGCACLAELQASQVRQPQQLSHQGRACGRCCRIARQARQADGCSDARLQQAQEVQQAAAGAAAAAGDIDGGTVVALEALRDGCDAGQQAELGGQTARRE